MQLSDAVHDLLNSRQSGVLATTSNSTSVIQNPVNTRTIKRNQASVGCVGAHLLPKHDYGCRCGSCATGFSKSVWAGIDPSCQSCSCDNPSMINVPMKQKDCPDASMPWDVYVCKNMPLYMGVWDCFDHYTTACILDQYSSYKLCGHHGTFSVILAATHFVIMHTQINPNFGLAASKEASLGRAVAAMHPALLHNKGMAESDFGSNFWSMTSYGLEYMSIKKSQAAVSGMAWAL